MGKVLMVQAWRSKLLEWILILGMNLPFLDAMLLPNLTVYHSIPPGITSSHGTHFRKKWSSALISNGVKMA